MRAGLAALVALVLVFCGTAAGGPTTPDRAGPPAATETPTGKPLAPDDVHRQPGEPLAAPIIEGPMRDRRAPVLLYLHGGGWVITGRQALDDNRATIRRWSSKGVAVWGADYRRDGLSLPDAEAAYRALRRRVGSRRRICILGESSGGALALLVAAKYSRIDCVVTYAAVGDLRLLTSGPLATEVEDWLLPDGGYRRWDPMTNARRVRQPVVLVHHVADTTVPALHSRRLQRRLPHATLIELGSAGPSGVRTAHGQRTTREAERRAFRIALRLVRDRVRGWNDHAPRQGLKGLERAGRPGPTRITLPDR